MEFLKKQLDWLSKGMHFVLATIVKVEGSSPRDTGAKMLITPSETHDTIGGGAFEGAVIGRARDLLQSEAFPELFVFTLGPEYGMKCGGRVTVFLEPSAPPERVLIFGAGHVAKPLAALTHSLGYYTAIIDDRQEFNNRERFPNAHDLILGDINWPSSNSLTYIVILTRDAELDYQILMNYLEQPAKYIGMIGSKTKLESFKAKMKTGGIHPSLLDRVRSPIGLDIEAETPEEIAMSIAAQLIQIRRTPLTPTLSPGGRGETGTGEKISHT